jgi:hypothetical protein
LRTVADGCGLLRTVSGADACGRKRNVEWTQPQPRVREKTANSCKYYFKDVQW